MSYELFIGLRYLRAKRKQTFISIVTFISIIGIMVGVTALIVVLSVMTGFEETLREKILGLNAHVVVLGFGSSLANSDRVVEEVLHVEDVTGASAFTYNQAMLSAGGGAIGAVIRGLDPETIGTVTILPKRMTEGSLDGIKVAFGGKGDGLPGIVIGSELSKTIGAGTGDTINLISPMGTMTPAGPMPRMANFRVSGIFEFGMYEYDSTMAFISLENAQSFFRLGDLVTGVEVKITDIYEAEKVSADIQERLGSGYWTRTWVDMNKNLFSALKLEKAAMMIILTLIILVAALNIISTLTMLVMEKNKEIAILKSIGATGPSIMKIFMIEGLIIGFVGTLLGAVIGVAAAANLESIVAFIERLFNFTLLPPSIYYIDKMPSKVEPTTVALIVAISLGISFLATVYPSWQASRLNPVDGLRYE
jgi:lipoprotein-releasing system permease protein